MADGAASSSAPPTPSSTTLAASQILASANATEQVRQQNVKWADSIKKEDGTVLDKDMDNYQDWLFFLTTQLQKRDCIYLLSRHATEDRVERNNDKNIGLILAKFIDPLLYSHASKISSYATFDYIRSLQPDND